MFCESFNFISELFRYVYAYVCVRVPSHVRLFVTPWTVERQTPLSMEFSRQEYWSRLPYGKFQIYYYICCSKISGSPKEDMLLIPPNL